MTLVLLVDDHRDTVDVLRESLEDHGYFVLAAPDGERALYLLQNHLVMPDVIVLDMMMPNMDGAQFLQVKRADPKLAKIRVILCTGMPAERARASCEGDVLLVLPKPYGTTDILQVLGHLRHTSKNRPFRGREQDR